MNDATRKNDASQRASLWAVAGTGAALAVAALLLVGLHSALGVAVGGGLATLNLWAIGLIVGRLFSDHAKVAPWALFAVVKVAVLFGAVYLLVFSGFVDILAVVVGYGALPLGVMAAQLGARPSGDERG